MSAPKPDVSGPACQQREKHRLGEAVSKFVGALSAGAWTWPRDLSTIGIRVKGSGYCRGAFITRRTGYLAGQLIRMQTSVLLVVRSGSLIVETAQCPLPVCAGDSAIIAPGVIRFSEIPASYRGRVEYWVVFFKPDIFAQFIRDPVIEEIISRVTPAFAGCYLQKGFLRRLCAMGISDFTTDANAAFRLLVSGAWATVFMYLREHHSAVLEHRDESVDPANA